MDSRDERARITALRHEAAAAGDQAQVELCVLAEELLTWDSARWAPAQRELREKALAECRRVLAYAEAQEH